MNPIISTVSRPFRLVGKGSFPRRIGDGVSLPPWSWRVAAWAVVVSFAGYLGLEALRQLLRRAWQVDLPFPDLVDSTPGLCCLMYLARRTDASVGRLFGLTGTPLREVLVSAVGLAVLELFLTAATAGVVDALGCKGESESDTGLSVWIRFDMVIWGPLCEELLFRGLLYTALRTRLRIAPSTILTAAAFALVHTPYSVNKVAALFVPALLTSFWYERTRSLWPCILSHSLNNLLCLLPSLP